jgi:SpoVK/Ycf46/Vps4 family AAA+-type ATPase
VADGYFKIKSKLKLDELELGSVISESDYSTLTPEGNFIQLEYIESEEQEAKDYNVKPGIWVIDHSQSRGMFLTTTSFVKDRILDEFIHTKHITDKIELFFRKIQVYYDLGFEVPKRAALLFGPAGTGKSTALSKIAEQYGNDGETAVIVWPTSKYEAQHVKDFIKTFAYQGVKRLILFIEDIGGVEVDQVRMKSDSSLLSLLDNQEKTFTIPVFIIATTNHPEVFLGNLTNRPNRFDDKIEVGYPSKEARAALLTFFSKGLATEKALALIQTNKTDKFSPAHIREVVIRSMIYDKEFSEIINEMTSEIAHYEAGFEKTKTMGAGMFND